MATTRKLIAVLIVGALLGAGGTLGAVLLGQTEAPTALAGPVFCDRDTGGTCWQRGNEVRRPSVYDGYCLREPAFMSWRGTSVWPTGVLYQCLGD